ncbi:MAG TPA: bifunctional serine/threonine-protein kinase/formylglycine-generating enzyme family protein [Pyrinomonadaceae bacterium]|nr:bifunctional serine/threonine-protein kinase/formylglycine-generating enzyme family protein [Pyrinomonadaceae bacterium]
MLAPDTVLQNRYRIIGQLGRGGVGTVYEALDQRVNAVVALKETSVGDGNESSREFESEAGLLANLQHPALPKVMDYFVEGGSEFLVMEYIQGYDLLEMLTRRGAPFHIKLVLRWADAVLELLEYLHQRQPPILHRDIKPANLKITQQEEIFLLDFGLAKGAAGQMPTLLTNRSARGYTPLYAPLEQMLAQGTDARSDLYSLGATLYHLLTNVPPADAASRFQQLEDGKPDPLLPVHQLNPQVPPSVANVLHQAMAISRKNRPKSAADMRQALQRAMDTAKRPAQSKQPQQEASGLRAAELEPRKIIDAAKPFAPPVLPAPIRRKNLGVLIAVLILAVIAIVAAVVMMRRTDSGNKGAANVNPTPAPQPSASTVKPKPTASKAQPYTENINRAPLEMTLIPGGAFSMGSPDGEGYDAERPQHQVTVQTFYLGKYEVTQAQWQALMSENPSEFKGDNLPVEHVSWNDAVEFCKRLSAKTGREYRLPSEAEWEYACRAGTTTPFAFGNSLTSAQANFDGRSPANDAGIFRQRPTPVGSFQANRFGLYDMHGNVWEWCLDVYHDSYDGAPSDGSAWLGASGYRTLRGGSWLSVADGLRSAVRERLAQDENFAGIGFRIAADAR